MESPTRYARSGDVSIAYRVHGEGPLDLLFVPGFVSEVELVWEHPRVARFFRRLTSFARLITFDKRGQGLSDRLGRPPTLEESMDDLIAVMDDAGLAEAALFGISEGGPMAALAAATHPRRIRALALYGTFARILWSPDYPEGIPAAGLERLQERITRDWGGPALVEMWAPTAAGDPEFERWWARLLRQGTSPRGTVELLDLYREIDARSMLSAIDCPTLVVHRGGDRMVPVEMGRRVAEGIPGARFVELEGDDHLAFAGDADALIDEVEEFLVGSRRGRDPDRELATVLFTDVVDSTATAARLGDRRWRELLEHHDSVVRRELELHRGHEVKTLGDGFLATFDGPARGIRCAQAIRDRLADVGIDVRAGLHTGEVEIAGGDVSGMAVNIGARVGALAESGEVLASSTIKDLVVGSGLEFTDRGTHELKGVPGEWRIFAVND